MSILKQLSKMLDFHSKNNAGLGSMSKSDRFVTVFEAPEVCASPIGLWSKTGNMKTPRSSHTETVLPNGKVLVADGFSNGDGRSAEVYDPATGIWKRAGNMTVPRSLHTATILPNGKVFVTGGFTTLSERSAELYDPATGTWTQTGNMI